MLSFGASLVKLLFFMRTLRVGVVRLQLMHIWMSLIHSNLLKIS